MKRREEWFELNYIFEYTKERITWAEWRRRRWRCVEEMGQVENREVVETEDIHVCCSLTCTHHL